MKKFISQIAIALLVVLALGLGADAAVTTNATQGSGSAGGGYPARADSSVYLIPFKFDARDTGNSVAASNDSVVVFHIRSNSLVRGVGYAVVVSNGSACSFSIGDGTTATQFAGVAVGTAVIAPTFHNVAPATGFYASNDTFRLHFLNAATGIVIQGTAEVVDLNP